VLIVKPVSERNDVLIPGLPATRLITAYEENCHPTRIEGKQDTQVSLPRSQLLHIRVTRPLDRINEWASQPWSMPLENFDRDNDGFLLVLIKVLKTVSKLIGVLDLSCHEVEYDG
jgi:hypothetical protein